MRVYFVAAISQREELESYYKRIVDILEKAGHEVQSEHVFTQTMETIVSESDDEKVKYYRKFLKWITKADVVVVEATFPSTVHIGHEISIALEKNKPVIVLHQKSKSPVFLEGIVSDRLVIREYTNQNLDRVLLDAIDYASERQDTRFNFFISRKLMVYLDWIAKKRRMPRAVYLRNLISREMRKYSEFR